MKTDFFSFQLKKSLRAFFSFEFHLTVSLVLRNFKNSKIQETEKTVTHPSYCCSSSKWKPCSYRGHDSLAILSANYQLIEIEFLRRFSNLHIFIMWVIIPKFSSLFEIIPIPRPNDDESFWVDHIIQP